MTPEDVKEALKLKCGLCGAEPGCDCTSVIDGKPLWLGPRGLDMPVHYYRKAS